MDLMNLFRLHCSCCLLSGKQSAPWSGCRFGANRSVRQGFCFFVRWLCVVALFVVFEFESMSIFCADPRAYETTATTTTAAAAPTTTLNTYYKLFMLLKFFVLLLFRVFSFHSARTTNRQKASAHFICSVLFTRRYGANMEKYVKCIGM